MSHTTKRERALGVLLGRLLGREDPMLEAIERIGIADAASGEPIGLVAEIDWDRAAAAQADHVALREFNAVASIAERRCEESTASAVVRRLLAQDQPGPATRSLTEMLLLGAPRPDVLTRARTSWGYVERAAAAEWLHRHLRRHAVAQPAAALCGHLAATVWALDGRVGYADQQRTARLLEQAVRRGRLPLRLRALDSSVRVSEVCWLYERGDAPELVWSRLRAACAPSEPQQVAEQAVDELPALDRRDSVVLGRAIREGRVRVAPLRLRRALPSPHVLERNGCPSGSASRPLRARLRAMAWLEQQGFASVWPHGGWRRHASGYDCIDIMLGGGSALEDAIAAAAKNPVVLVPDPGQEECALLLVAAQARPSALAA